MKYIKQDISKLEGMVSIAHGVNCKNVMGSGVAKALYSRWPRVKEQYHAYFNKRLGAVQTVPNGKGNPIVYNCFTQETYGRHGIHANRIAISICLTKCAIFSLNNKRDEVYIPRIGAGLGGLNWEKDIVPIIDMIEESTPIEFIVCDL